MDTKGQKKISSKFKYFIFVIMIGGNKTIRTEIMTPSTLFGEVLAYSILSG
jgi:hypothetical protein